MNNTITPLDAICPHGVDWEGMSTGERMISEKLVENSDEVAAFLTMLGNSKRLAIMSHLIDGEMTVGSIAEKVSLSQSALSQHLAKLREMNLVNTRRERQMIYYSCKSDEAVRLLRALDTIFGER